jgi:hypothetical protein
VGRAGEVVFEAACNASGGAFDHRDASAGRAIWIPGEEADGVADVIAATDSATGARYEVRLDVVAHPAPHLVAEFGASDVWFVDFSRRFGSHGLPRDWDETLHALGLRSDRVVPTVADALADYYARREVLSALNVLFGREADGRRGTGLPISFPMESPLAPYVAPPPSGWSAPSAERYNVISMVSGSHAGVLGMAFLDGPQNALIENDTPDGTEADLGVFANQVARAYNASFQNNTLPADPVREEDEPTLRALLHGRPVEGLRATLIERAAKRFGRAAAMILAHEIGHSLGLEHTNPVAAGSIMNGGASIYPGAEYAFVPADLDRLHAGLPGPGRTPGSSKPDHVPAAPAGGIAPCCRLHLVPPPAASD